MVYNKEPIKVLWDITKRLMFGANNRELTDGITIYRETMQEAEKNVPESYILLRSQVVDDPRVYGDGKTLIRSASCDIILVTKGYGDDSTDLHNTNKTKIRNHLKNQDISFTEVNVGYDRDRGTTEHTFTLEVKYIA